MQEDSPENMQQVVGFVSNFGNQSECRTVLKRDSTKRLFASVSFPEQNVCSKGKSTEEEIKEVVSASCGKQQLYELSSKNSPFDKIPELSNVSDSDSDEDLEDHDENKEDPKQEENCNSAVGIHEGKHKDVDLEEDLRRAQETISNLLELLNDHNNNTEALKKEIKDIQAIRKRERKELRDLKKAHGELQMEVVEHKQDVAFLEEELQVFAAQMKQDMFRRLENVSSDSNESLHDTTFHEILLVEY